MDISRIAITNGGSDNRRLARGTLQVLENARENNKETAMTPEQFDEVINTALKPTAKQAWLAGLEVPAIDPDDDTDLDYPVARGNR